MHQSQGFLNFTCQLESNVKYISDQKYQYAINTSSSLVAEQGFFIYMDIFHSTKKNNRTLTSFIVPIFNSFPKELFA